MTCLEHLPNEVLMRILAHLNIIDLSQFGQVSKKFQNFCKDDFLRQKCVEKNNLYNKRVPIKFLERILDNGCKYLSIKNVFLGLCGINPVKPAEKLILNKTPKLKYLDITNCSGKENILQSLLASCHSLEKFALQNHLQDEKCSAINWKVSAKMISNLCYQNGKTLQVCIFSDYEQGKTTKLVLLNCSAQITFISILIL